jgi:hypothetical protein
MNKTFRRLLSAVVCFALLTTSAGSSVIADSEVQHQDLFSFIEAKHDPAIVNGIAKIWTDDFGDAVSFIIANNFDISKGGASKGPGVICSSLSDSACDPRTPRSAMAKTVLGICQSQTELGCIESVSYKNSSLSLENLTLVSIPPTVRAENTMSGIPRGAAMSIWEASNGTRYVVAAVVQSHLMTEKNLWGKAASTASFSISRVKRDYVVPTGSAEIRTDSATQPGKPTLTLGGGFVNPTLEFEAGSFFALVVRVPDSVGGFFRGRLANAVVETYPSLATSTTYVIQGDVSPVYIAGAEANADDPKSPALGSFARGFYRTISSATYLEDYAEWKHLIGDRSLTTRSYWQVISTVTNEQRCFESGKRINGLVSTNSSFYSPYPPVFNSTTGTFDYKVASPHFDENGNVAVGKYSLSVPLSVLQCLYGSDVIPGTAEISFTYADGSPTQTLQQSVTVAGEWANVSVSGLHFSSPIIRTKFAVPYRTRLSKRESISLRSMYRTKASQRPKWTAVGSCKISGSRLVASGRKGTCKVTLRVLNSKKRYVVSLRRSFRVS